MPTDSPVTDIRVGHARCSHLTQELQSQLDALEAHGIKRERIFSEQVSTRVRVRPKFEAALELCRQIKAHAPRCRVILTVYEMKRLGRDSAELTAHGTVLEMLTGPLPDIYDPTGSGRILFAFFAAMAETDRENIREATLEGLNAAARKGKHGGRPPVITDDMLHTVLRRRANGESVASLRRSYVTHLIGDGWDPRFVQEQVGHEHASTTSIYTCVSSDFRRRTLRRHLDAMVAEALHGQETRA